MMNYSIFETDTENNRYYRLSQSTQRRKVAVSSFMTFAAVASAFASDDIRHEWEIESHHTAKSTDDIFYKRPLAPLRNQPVSQIGSGTLRGLDPEIIMLSLSEHKGESVPENSLKMFRNVLDKFAGIPYLDCVAMYSKVNRMISTTIVLENDLCFNFTFFVDRKMDRLPYSVYHEDESIVVGSCSSDELGKSLRDFIESVAKVNETLSC